MYKVFTHGQYTKCVLLCSLLLSFWALPAFADDQGQPATGGKPNPIQKLLHRDAAPIQQNAAPVSAMEAGTPSGGDSVHRQLPVTTSFGSSPGKNKPEQIQRTEIISHGYVSPDGYGTDKETGDPDLMSLDRQDTIVVAMPDVANHIEMSSSDMNLIVCPTAITDADEGVATSSEKHVTVKVKGRYALVKFMAKKGPEENGDEKVVYSTTPTEIYVICGEEMFKIIAHPRRIPARTVNLSLGAGDRIRKNESFFGASSYKKKILSIANAVYKEEIPDSFTVTNENKVIGIYDAFTVKLRRSIKIDGEGFRVKEYLASLKPDAGNIELRERDFLRKAFTGRPAYIEIDNHHPKIGDIVRIIIIEHIAAQETAQ